MKKTTRLKLILHSSFFIFMNAECKNLVPRTKMFARRVIRLYSALPKETVAQVLGKQALRSGTSVGANYREANRARSKAEFIAKIGECLREIDETAYWLELLVDEKVVRSEKLAALQDEASQLTAIFVSILKNSKQNVAKAEGRM